MNLNMQHSLWKLLVLAISLNDTYFSSTILDLLLFRNISLIILVSLIIWLCFKAIESVGLSSCCILTLDFLILISLCKCESQFSERTALDDIFKRPQFSFCIIPFKIFYKRYSHFSFGQLIHHYTSLFHSQYLFFPTSDTVLDLTLSSRAV